MQLNIINIIKIALRGYPMKIFYVVLLLILSSCYCGNNSNKQKSAIAGIIPLQQDNRSTKALEARYLSPLESDTMMIYVDGQRYKVSVMGEVLDHSGGHYFNIESEHPIGLLYYVQRGEDFFVFYSYDDFQESFSMVKRISLNTREVVWSTQVEGSVFSCPVIYGQFAYISTMGHIGKLILKNGLFDWQFNKIQKDGRYGRFGTVNVLGGNKVQFISPHPFSLQNDTIVVNDITGEIIRMN